MFSSNTSQVVATSTQAEAVDFDGTNDYLRRTSDLTGNTTSKTFTFSTWIWQGDTATSYFYVVSDGTNQRFVVRVVSGTVSVEGTNNSNSVILQVTAPLTAAARTNTFYHVLISMDMANTANRSIYINDIAQTLTVTTYTNATIPFNQVDHVIAGTQGGAAGDKGRLSNVYLDYTYRDLSITANRRLFITADLKPAAGQAALNPILYLPMSNPTTVGTNAGTGGNFTLTGTVARSGRGPNQYNAPYSNLDGAADFLSRTSLSGIAAGKQFTVSANFSLNNIAASNAILWMEDVSMGTILQLWYSSSGKIVLRAARTDGSSSLGTVLNLDFIYSFIANRNYQLTISIDLTNTSNRHVYLNGENASAYLTWLTYSSANNIGFDWVDSYRVGASPSGTYLNGRLGALWFNTSYIDLSVASNLAKFVSGTGIDAKPVDLGATGELPTGTSPLIYLPMYGNNAGKNYGTGGDFTVNSGPYTGARGPNEFWGNKADFNGTTGRLTRSSALSGVSDGKTISGSFWVMFDNASTNVRILTEATGSSNRLLITRTSGNALQIGIFNSSGGDVVNVSTIAGIFSSGTQYSVQFCFDVTNAAKRKIYINSEDMTLSVAAYNNQDMVFSGDNWTFGALYTGTYSQYLDGKLSEFYLTTEYIDFSQEANRLKFRDAFGNPTDLPSAITAASVPTPAVYMRFPPTSFGTNSGTGGDFTVSGTITDGGQL